MKHLILIGSLFFSLACDPEQGAKQIGDIFTGVGEAFTDSVDGALDELAKKAKENVKKEFLECLNSPKDNEEALKAKTAYDKWVQADPEAKEYEERKKEWEQAQDDFLNSKACQ